MWLFGEFYHYPLLSRWEHIKVSSEIFFFGIILVLLMCGCISLEAEAWMGVYLY